LIHFYKRAALLLMQVTNRTEMRLLLPEE